eukprot:CAMPEP_0119132120 /NCGR_PEP_ID=MMETSP1310-20130426/11546_1 /TAXON_ID=464262 /ORGANISM="Genus nov. species nov., Strain RCC2339" /LENGTH=321 /DNA_ID=CAMNT_0007122735 /DNA_START=123 /DNA_END=1088 /DNA_ORIENTATION=+
MGMHTKNGVVAMVLLALTSLLLFAELARGQVQAEITNGAGLTVSYIRFDTPPPEGRNNFKRSYAWFEFSTPDSRARQAEADCADGEQAQRQGSPGSGTGEVFTSPGAFFLSRMQEARRQNKDPYATQPVKFTRIFGQSNMTYSDAVVSPDQTRMSVSIVPIIEDPLFIEQGVNFDEMIWTFDVGGDNFNTTLANFTCEMIGWNFTLSESPKDLLQWVWRMEYPLNDGKADIERDKGFVYVDEMRFDIVDRDNVFIEDPRSEIPDVKTFPYALTREIMFFLGAYNGTVSRWSTQVGLGAGGHLAIPALSSVLLVIIAGLLSW